MIKKYLTLLILILPLFAVASNIRDTVPGVNDTIATLSRQRIYLEKNGDSFICNRPKLFNFVTHIPGDAIGYVKQSFRKENLYKVAIVAASTALLIIFDQKITDEVQGFSKRNGISAREDFDPILRVKLLGKNTNIGKMPHNFNTAFYNIGQGSSVVLMAAGFYIGGLIKKDNRAMQTASQLGEAFLALGFGTQLMKYSSGRENPSDASIPGGKWRPFPTLKNFQNNKTKYDAFPSGHLATFVSAITIISQNYPRIKWIKPVGYTISGLIGLAMINNGVHWAGDFPLGFAMGYGFGKFITKKNHLKLRSVI